MSDVYDQAKKLADQIEHDLKRVYEERDRYANISFKLQVKSKITKEEILDNLSLRFCPDLSRIGIDILNPDPPEEWPTDEEKCELLRKKASEAGFDMSNDSTDTCIVYDLGSLLFGKDQKEVSITRAGRFCNKTKLQKLGMKFQEITQAFENPPIEGEECMVAISDMTYFQTVLDENGEPYAQLNVYKTNDPESRKLIERLTRL